MMLNQKAASCFSYFQNEIFLVVAYYVNALINKRAVYFNVHSNTNFTPMSSNTLGARD